MKIRETGVTAMSEIYFHTPSEQARELFFYPVCTGHYYCEADYRVSRNNYDSFLILYVVSGKGYLEQNGKRIILTAGCFFLIDCYVPHTYGTDDEWEIYWLHFDGALARRYFELCTAGPYPAGEMGSAARSLRKIYDAFHAGTCTNEAMLSRRIVDLLTELLLYNTPEQNAARNISMIDDVISYMREHMTEPLSVATLAARVSVTPYHFIRLFKNETGFTPHRYLIHLRIDLAKYLLKTTTLPLKEIAEQTGFCSASNFCTAFQHQTGLTPTAYRLAKENDQNAQT